MTKIKVIINLIIFLVSLFLLHYGHRETSLKNLAIMLVGMFGVLYVLYKYNKSN
ncbi:DUF6903 family protein [Oceanivirga miroungae]|uniref:Uncharacterized protein n=1 Tax=Oceanivirga miroungae TaxID=1130046 RepID=A0A6I8MD47_9FUSO|nr:hypothetical protein [Oceanivirga miroungae]VWL85019.1 hypothetical protein OMES3154_00290 [Oceanivirga miroungae]